MSLAVRDLAMRACAATLLAGITAAFPAGAITVVLGPNGAGKSTLMAALAGLRAPAAGAVTLDGDDLARLAASERARRIGYLPQAAELHWDLEVRELVALGRLPRQGRFAARSAEDDAAIDAALAATATAAFAGRRAGSLSGGERARVLLARVLAGRPDWILADEPLAALDPAHQRGLLDVLRAAARAGTGVVLTLHDLLLAGAVADRVLILKEGRTFAQGSAELLGDAGLLERLYGVPMARVERPDGPPLLVPAPR